MRRRYDKTVFNSWLKRQDMNLSKKELYKMYQEFTNETLSIQGFVWRIEKVIGIKPRKVINPKDVDDFLKLTK